MTTGFCLEQILQKKQEGLYPLTNIKLSTKFLHNFLSKKYTHVNEYIYTMLQQLEIPFGKHPCPAQLDTFGTFGNSKNSIMSKKGYFYQLKQY